MTLAQPFRLAWRALRGIAAGGLLILFAVLAWMEAAWPPPSWWRTHWPAQTAFQRMRTGQYLDAGDTTARQYTPVPLDSISDWIARAATAGEDDAFFAHAGIDFRALRQALGYPRERFDWRNPRDRADLLCAIGRAYQRRDRLRGASTITQQLAKNIYLSSSRNPLRKLKEAALAYRLEWALSKERILELYLNVAELGPNLWGVEAASHRYFRRRAAAVSLEQAALLVATLPHPLTSNPSFRPGRTRWRQQYILRRLRGERVEMPVEVDEPSVLPPAAVAPATDTVRTPLNDSAVVPPKDTTAGPPRPKL